MMNNLALKKHLAQPKTSWQLCLLAALGGVASAAIVILFTFSIKELQNLYLVLSANYINSDLVSRMLLPIIGALVILLSAMLTGYQYLRTGIPFVLHRLKVAYGVMPLRNTVNQFIGSTLAIASGFSVGREGPAVHLGAACSSYIGNKLHLPFNTVRTLCACGIAAAISASFNTPIAAVIFVMEVILREYKVYIFIPIMIAALVGSMITQGVYGPAHQYEFFDKIDLTVIHYPILMLFGIALGILASVFNKSLTTLIAYSSQFSLKRRLLIAALITGICSAFVPAAISTDIQFSHFNTEFSQPVMMVLLLLLAKLLMTITALGLGIPGGIIGPILVIGAISGVVAAEAVVPFLPGEHLPTDYALMGMAGFMAATLNAPLAALLAVVELSGQLEVIVPAMLVISTACVSSGQFFKNRSVFVMQLEVQNLLYRQPPIEKTLQRVGVLAAMNTTFELVSDTHIDYLSNRYLKDEGKTLLISRAVDQPELFIWHQARVSEDNSVQSFDNHPLIAIDSRATLAEAYNALSDARRGAVYIYQQDQSKILGILPFAQIRRFLLEGNTTS
ncbi:chloride channel protein [Thalassotalea sp. PP2-459]|uniref:chloride channel protein n=1 Tax=Thalassotalea sp. PP2-459 TaxID=1742724 RepID=UPI0009FAE1F4|nr:chloride channel protein [Thalassotalea sp. PP2-459]